MTDRADHTPVPEDEDEGSVSFEELMRAELRHNREPLSGLAVATFVCGLLGGVLAVFLAVAALVHIRLNDRRGVWLVMAGLAGFVVWILVAAFVKIGRAHV